MKTIQKSYCGINMINILLKIFIFLILSNSNVLATHLVGGELEFTREIGFTYKITLNIYLDKTGSYTTTAVNAPTQTVDIYSKIGPTFIQSVVLSKLSDSDLAYSNPLCAVGNISTIAIKYTANVILNPLLYNNSNGYFIEWNSCCRNINIVNILNAFSSSTKFYLEFPAIINSQNQSLFNSSPTNAPVIGDYACLFSPFVTDYSVTDPDGDSIAYSLITPLGSVFWAPGFNVNNQIPGPQPLKIDSNGRLSFTPSMIGLFLFGIKYEEFRNGVKIGEVVRDFQIYVLDCGSGPNNNPQVFAVKEDGFTLTRNDTIILTSNEFCIDIKGIDIDTNTKIIVSYTGLNFPSSNIIQNNLADSVNFINSNDTATFKLCLKNNCGTNSDSLYNIQVLIRDNTCPFGLTDTIKIWVKAGIPFNNPPKLVHFDPTNGNPVAAGDTLSIIGNSRCLFFYCIDPDTLTKLSLEVFALNFNQNNIKQIQNNGFVNTVDDKDTIILSFCIPDCQLTNGGVYTMSLLLNDQGCIPRLIDSLDLAVKVFGAGVNTPTQIFGFDSIKNEIFFSGDTLYADTVNGCISFIVIDTDPLSNLNFNINLINFSNNLISNYNPNVITNFLEIGDTAIVTVCLNKCIPQIPDILQANISISDITCGQLATYSALFYIKPKRIINNKPRIFGYDSINQNVVNSLDTINIFRNKNCITLLGIDIDQNSKLVLKVDPINFPTSFINGFTNIGFTNTISNPSDTTSFTVCFNSNWKCTNNIWKLSLEIVDSFCFVKNIDSLILYIKPAELTNNLAELVFFDNNDSMRRILTADDVISVNYGTNCLEYYIVDPDTNTIIDISVSNIINELNTITSFTNRVQLNTFTSSDTAIAEICFKDCIPGLGEVASISLKLSDNYCFNNNLTDSIQINLNNVPENAPIIELLNATSPIDFNIYYDSINVIYILIYDIDNDSLDISISYNQSIKSVIKEDIVLNGNEYIVKFEIYPECSSPKLHQNIRIKVTDNSCHNLSTETQIELNFLENQSTLQALPNIVTPNGDGYNDYFSISQVNWSCRFKNISIKDRWGRQVLYDTNPEFRWDANGLTDGQYFYFIEFEGTQLNGYIMVMR